MDTDVKMKQFKHVKTKLGQLRAKQNSKRGQVDKTDKSFDWRQFRFTYCQARHGGRPAFSVTCPFSADAHRSKLKFATGCKRRRGFQTVEGPEGIILKMKAWILASTKCNDRLSHQLWEPTSDDLEAAKPAKPPTFSRRVRSKHSVPESSFTRGERLD